MYWRYQGSTFKAYKTRVEHVAGSHDYVITIAFFLERELQQTYGGKKC